MTTHAQEATTAQWVPWGQSAFQRAGEEDKLVLVDSGATWCHWCHVMDRVTYEDPEVIALLNERFVPVRIDRDRLPHVDAALQRAPTLVQSSGGGWPLTVVLTPDGHVLYRTTFLPPRAEAKYGARMGLIGLLNELDRLWREKRADLAVAGEELAQRYEDYRQQTYNRPASLRQDLINAVISGVRRQMDPVHGGMKGAPKFYQAPAMELLARAAWTGDGPAGEALTTTLTGITHGGVHDHVGGGFHRYSVDERWHVPHFEKMAYDNAALIRLYANAYAATGDESFAHTARRAVAWVGQEMTADEGKGFYASQDADVGLDDDGDYFTWTAAEVRQAVGKDAPAILSYYGVDTSGDMHGRPGRNVLHTPKTIDQLAKLMDRPEEQLAELIGRANTDLLAARRKRPTPTIDKTVFADSSGMLIDAHLTAWQRLDDEQAKATALTALDAALADLRDSRGAFGHYQRRSDGQLMEVGLLTDQAWMLRALVGAYAATLDEGYLVAARRAADFILSELTDEGGGLLSAPSGADDHAAAIGPSRSWEDAPSRSAASVAAEDLIRLGYLTGEETYPAAAVTAMETFAGAVDDDQATFLAGYALAVDTALNGPRTVIVVGPADSPVTGDLAQAARRAYIPGGMVLQIDPAVGEQAALLNRLGYAAHERPVAYVCRGRLCLLPAESAAELGRRLGELAGSDASGGKRRDLGR